MADIARAPELEKSPESGLKLWRFADILRDKTWGGQDTLDMIADALVGLGWKIDAARVRRADKQTNLADVIARIEAEARRLDKAWLDRAMPVLHEWAGRAVGNG